MTNEIQVSPAEKIATVLIADPAIGEAFRLASDSAVHAATSVGTLAELGMELGNLIGAAKVFTKEEEAVRTATVEYMAAKLLSNATDGLDPDSAKVIKANGKTAIENGILGASFDAMENTVQTAKATLKAAGENDHTGNLRRKLLVAVKNAGPDAIVKSGPRKGHIKDGVVTSVVASISKGGTGSGSGSTRDLTVAGIFKTLTAKGKPAAKWNVAEWDTFIAAATAQRDTVEAAAKEVIAA